MLPLLKGMLLGLSIAAPVGPIGILCIRRTLAFGRLYGFLSGLGAATADACYGLVAGLGLTLIMNFLLDQKMLLQAAGGLFLLYFGIQTFRSSPATDPAKAKSESLLSAYLSTLMLTLSNPMTILSFVGLFTGLGLGAGQGALSSTVAFIAGVFTGSALWWLTISVIVGIWRDRLKTGALKWVNRISGVIVILFGIISLLSLL
ncbi:LysE/ArgO family amino acid transporter [Paenibacillus cremeus]|uniref:LysE family translocator n=1 Tax=Paenibacillus cremeus TaxID=2163881 RepID=A0A559K6M9_9BACL|nr:LysE family transporter [Paenibacillus cremeus]TVY07781.1 LysE family translocator [Paenibacillus cremeus]